LFTFGFVKITPNIHYLINYKAIAGSHDNRITGLGKISYGLALLLEISSLVYNFLREAGVLSVKTDNGS